MMNGKELSDTIADRILNLDERRIRCLAIGTDKETIVAGLDNGLVRVWKISSDIGKFTVFTGHTSSVIAIAITTTNEIVVSGSIDTIRLWSLKSGRCIHTLGRPTINFKNYEFFIAKNGYLKEKNIASVCGIGQYHETIKTYVDISFQLNQDSLMTSRHDSTLCVCDYSYYCLLQVYSLESNSVIEKFTIDHGNIWKVILCDDDVVVSCGDLGKRILVWSLKRKCFLQNIILESGYEWNHVALAEDRDTLVISSRKWKNGACDSKISTYSIKKSNFLWESDVITSQTLQYRLSAPLIKNDHLYIVTSVNENIIFKYAYKISEIEDKKKSMFDSETNNSGSVKAYMSSIKVDWKPSSDVSSTTLLKGHTDVVTCIDVGSDNNTVVSGSRDNTVRIWSLDHNKCTRIFERTWLGLGTPGHSSWVNSVSIGPDNDTVVSGGKDKTIKVWSIKNGILLREFREHKKSVNSVYLAKDNDTIVSGSSDNTIKIFSLKTGNCHHTINCHREVRYAAITSNYEEVIYQVDGGFEHRYINQGSDTQEKIDRYYRANYFDLGWDFALGNKDVVLYHQHIGNCKYVCWVQSFRTGCNIAQLEPVFNHGIDSNKFALSKNNDIAVTYQGREAGWKNTADKLFRADVWSLQFGRWLMGLNFCSKPNQIKLLEREDKHCIIAACSDNNIYLHRLNPPRVPASHRSQPSYLFEHKKIKAQHCITPMTTPLNPITESYPTLREREGLQNAAIIAAVTGNIFWLFGNKPNEINLIRVIMSYMDEHILSDAHFIGMIPEISRPYMLDIFQNKMESSVKQLTDAFNIAIGKQDGIAIETDNKIIDFESLKKNLSDITNLNVPHVQTIIFSYCYQTTHPRELPMKKAAMLTSFI